jgi:DNA-binding transcriptional LysR family regulator
MAPGPGNTVHWANYTKRSSVNIAHIDTTAFDGLPRSCAVFALTGLLQELVMRAIDLGWHWPVEGRVEGSLTLNDTDLILKACLAGAGLACLPESFVM